MTPRTPETEPRTEAGRALMDLWIADTEVSGQLDWQRMHDGIAAIEAEARSAGAASLDVARTELAANRAWGVKWEPPVESKVQRWYAEGYDRGLRDAEAILARLAEGTDR